MTPVHKTSFCRLQLPFTPTLQCTIKKRSNWRLRCYTKHLTNSSAAIYRLQMRHNTYYFIKYVSTSYINPGKHGTWICNDKFIREANSCLISRADFTGGAPDCPAIKILLISKSINPIYIHTHTHTRILNTILYFRPQAVYRHTQHKRIETHSIHTAHTHRQYQQKRL